MTRHSAIPEAATHSAKTTLDILPDPSLGLRGMGFSPCRPTVFKPRKHSPRECEAPAEPKSPVNIPLLLFTDNRSPGIPARQPFSHTNLQRRAR